MQSQDIKLCLLGDSGVGKSSVAHRFCHNTFNAANESTIGASFMTKSFIYNNMHYKLNIWDTAGQERYRALSPMYYRGSSVSVIIYDVTSMKSFKSVQTWIKELHSYLTEKVVIAIAGNKCDLIDKREVTAKDAKAYAESVGAMFIEMSAKNSQNVQELFCNIVSKLPKETRKPSTTPTFLSLNSPNVTDNQKSKKCCTS